MNLIKIKKAVKNKSLSLVSGTLEDIKDTEDDKYVAVQSSTPKNKTENKKAVKKLAGFMAKKGNGNFAKVIGKDNYCYIHLQEISENKNRVLFEDDDEINRDIISNLLSADEVLEVLFSVIV